MEANAKDNAAAEFLKSAKVNLIIRVEHGQETEDGGLEMSVVPHIVTTGLGWDHVDSEGYDPTRSIFGAAVYWRFIVRGNELLYCSTFLARRTWVLQSWGPDGLAYCNSVTGMAVVRLETVVAQLSELSH